MTKPAIQIEQPLFDYRDLSANDSCFLAERAQHIREAAKRTAQGIVQIGQWLSEAKGRLKHGQWLPWLRTEFGWSDRTAQNFLQVHRAFKSANFSDLEIDVSALYLIAAPKTPQPVRAAIIERAQTGEPISYAKATAMVENHIKCEIADQFPFMQREEWQTHHVLQARDILNTLPQSEHQGIRDVFAVAGMPPSPGLGIEMLQNLQRKPEQERAELYRMSRSNDSRERSLALTETASRPPMPDPRLWGFDAALIDIKTARRTFRRSCEEFPDDAFTPRLERAVKDVTALVELIETLRNDIERADKEARRASAEAGVATMQRATRTAR
jgi:hypothetical protein